MSSIRVDWQRREFIIPVSENASLGAFGTATAAATNTSFETLKLLQGGRIIVPAEAPHNTVAEAGLRVGGRVRLLASAESDVQAVRSSRDLPGLPSFEHEELRAAARRRTAGVSQLSLPTGPYTFGSYQAWEGVPPDAFPSAVHALKLLHRLAADRGIVGIMAKHKWRVDVLSEMPPEGKVGISPVCLLGVNINAGQEISLRLRTDDLKGFRRYQKIRETLVHELTHILFGDHDNNFKQLNSQLLREAGQLDWTTLPGHTTGGYAASDDGDDEMPAPPTVQRLGGPSASAPPTAAAGAAALQRFSQAQAQAAEAGAAATASAAEGLGGGKIPGMGHRNRGTEAAEEAMASLGGSAAAAGCHPDVASQPSDARTAQLRAAPSSQPDASSLDMPSTGAAEPISDPAGAASGSEQQQQPAPAAAAVLSVPVDVECDAADSQPPVASGLPETPTAAPAELQQHHANKDQADMLADIDQLGLVSSRCGAGASGSSGGTSVGDSQRGEASGDGMLPGEATDVQQRYQQVQQVVASLAAPTPQQRQLVLASLQTVLQNALSSSDPKFRRVRQSNPAFQSRLGQFPQAVDVMKMAGFVEETEPDPALVLKRDDPGLLWLTLTALKDSMVH